VRRELALTRAELTDRGAQAAIDRAAFQSQLADVRLPLPPFLPTPPALHIPPRAGITPIILASSWLPPWLFGV